MAHLAVRGGDKVRQKPFADWPVFGDSEKAALEDVLKSGQWGGIELRLVPQIEQQFAALHQCDYGVSVTNGTTALEITIRAMEIGYGDEVILSPYTFVASASSVMMNNATPVFVDVEHETLNIDPNAIEAAITERTKAIMAVHIAGMPCDMDAILQIARKHNLLVIEDCAQAHGAEWGGQRVGSIGDAGTFSFQSSKNLTCGEGGMIVTNNEEIFQKCWSIHNVGRRQGGGWYEHPILGSNHRMTEWQAAILLTQMNRFPQQMQTRESNAAYLTEQIRKIPGIQPQKRPDSVTAHAWHLFPFRYLKDHFGEVPRQRFIQALEAEGIPCSAGYVPLYREAVFTRLSQESNGRIKPTVDYSSMSLPKCEILSDEEAVWMHQRVLLGTRSDMDSIVEAVAKIQKHHAELELM